MIRVPQRVLALPRPESETGFARVLIGVDFGPASLAAARWATQHVARGAHAILAHVIAFPDATDHTERRGALRQGAIGEMAPALTGGLDGFAATLDLASARPMLRVGRPSQWLSRIAARAEASLVILGRRGDANRRGVGEPNVIERITRRTGASVLVVPEGTTAAPTHIVAAIDRGPFTRMVLATARALARMHECPLTVLHVEAPAVGAYDRVMQTAHQLRGQRMRPPMLAPEQGNAIVRRAPRWVERIAADGLSPAARVEFVTGDPAREIVATAAQRGSALVVVGKRGDDHAPMGSVGSVARELLVRAPMPVLAVDLGEASLGLVRDGGDDEPPDAA
jgi:nucleotide-binding universal stress UspA family protein